MRFFTGLRLSNYSPAGLHTLRERALDSARKYQGCRIWWLLQLVRFDTGNFSCRDCISRFQDCVICGADIERIDDDPQLQGLVERFIDGHARIKRPTVPANGESSPRQENPPSEVVSYEDVSLARGSFLIQHAMRVSRCVRIWSVRG